MGISHVYHNRDLLKDYHARGARAPGVPLVPPPMDMCRPHPFQVGVAGVHKLFHA